MIKPERLEPIQDLAGQRESAAASELAEARRLLAQREQQLRELENYREPPLAAAGVELLRNREAFRLRLAQAITQQKRAVELQRRQVELASQRWIGSRQKVQLYDKLADQARAHERNVAEKRDLRQLDELALRRAFAGR